MPSTIKAADRLENSIQALNIAHAHSRDYLSGLEARRVFPSDGDIDNLRRFLEPLPAQSSDPQDTLDLLAKYGAPATTATAAGRFFGLVVGGALPAALGARIMTSAWDQVVFNDATSPVGVALEKVAADWLLDILGLPAKASVGFVPGTTAGTLVCLSAARHSLLRKAGWDVQKQGLWGAPKIHVVASEQMHVINQKILSLLGIGSADIEFVPCDENGAIRLDALPELTANSLVLTQAGNVNSGGFDPIGEIAERANQVGAWVHVDGAFGLWAAASTSKRPLLQGFDKAHSWVTDAHKWLNTPYDCGIAFCRTPQDVHAVMATVAPYLKAGETASPKDMVPEFSRSARAIEVWAALRSLGREGVEDLVDGCCRHAETLANALKSIGFEILNDVVLNQVVATFPGHEDKMAELASRVQQSGEAWLGPTTWRGRNAIRISISSWVTQESDIKRTVKAIDREIESDES